MLISNEALAVLKEIGQSWRGGFLIYDPVQSKVLFDNGTTSLIIDRPGPFNDLSTLLSATVEEDRPYVTDSFTSAAGATVSTDIEFRLVRREGQIRQIHCSIVPVLSLGLLMIYVRDISQLKQHEDYLIEFGAKKNTLLDTLAHQISGALYLSRNFSHELRRRILEEDVVAHDYFQLIDKNTTHCLRIIADLMNEEHLESPQIFVKKTRMNLVQKVNFVIEELRKSYKNREFKVHVSNPALSVISDDIKLLQVLNNLISNAVKFSKESDDIIIRLAEDEHSAIISVEDKGIGIPESLKPFVFDRKGPAGRPGLNGEQSQGLGLSICKRLIELLDGTIGFESNEGNGSRFFVRIPK